ncbi:MAG: hypothetical protein GX946_10180, partial [Oligosphaeraceae bacterium]|nr:hypothetical protein [Oligosphaeraceae bacterium]
SLRDLLPFADKTAMVVFPLAGQSGHPPALARLYLLQDYPGKSSRDRFTFTTVIPENCAILLAGVPETSGEQIEGDSWQLAARLAQAAIHEPDLRLTLGAAWVCTGAVDVRGAVTQVQLGNKPELTRRSNRRWLLPEDENFADWSRAAEPGANGFAVRNLAEALTYVRECGIVPHQFVFPEDVDELHVLLGNALPPVLAVCMQIFPKRLCLWYSEKTRPHAEVLEKVLDALSKVELHAVPSDNMAVVEVRMRERLLESDGCFRLVNITGGNRMMGFAAMLAARHCRISLVYRDIDAQDEQLEMIDFTNDPNLLPRNGKILGNNCPEKWRKKINWKKLYDRQTQPKPGTAPTPEWLREILWKTDGQNS